MGHLLGGQETSDLYKLHMHRVMRFFDVAYSVASLEVTCKYKLKKNWTILQ